MEENSAMIGVKREEEIELDLALSIGGGFKNLNRTKSEPDVQKTGGYDTDLQIDFESKREIEALRRLGSKRKRQEKQQKKRTCNNGGGNGVGLDNRVWLKSPELEHELDVKVQDCKKIKVEKEEEEEIGGPRSNYNNMGMKNGNLNFTVQQNGVHMNNNNNNQNVAGFNSTVCPVMYPYPPVQYVQFANGFPYPCLNVVPCWAAAGGGAGNEQNMVQSVVGRIFSPFGSGHDPGQNMGNGYGSDQDSRKAGSNGSPVCSSSAVSGYRSSSHEGGGSSDTRSHSSHSLPEQCKLQDSIATEAKGQSEHSASSHLRETAQVYDETTNCSAYCGKPKTSSNNAQRSPSSVGQKIPSKAVDCSQAKPKDESATELPTENLSPPVAKESKKDMGKPPKPQTHNQNQKTPPLPHMPCVSATGNGPNGKTIHGFLYRYTKTEVSIICVCHGTSFSPAEFVQHAGGTDVSHPLKHITVVPSAF